MAQSETPTWAVPGANVVVIGDVRFWVCPKRGPNCFRVSTVGTGDEWAQDAVDVHVQVSHPFRPRGWR